MRRRRSSVAPGLVTAIFALGATALAVWLTAGAIRDHLRKPAATAAADAGFATIQAVMAAQLRQRGPLEFGAVWATHSGRICGLVNGKSSFGGKIGMVPFYTAGQAAGRPIVDYGADAAPAVFGEAWNDCAGDMWIELVKGSTEQGYCATREGAARCYLTSERQPG